MKRKPIKTVPADLPPMKPDAIQSDPIHRWGALAAATLALVLFLNILPNTFIWDDWEQIFGNSFLRSSDGIGRIFSTNVWGFEGKGTNYYRPMMHLTFYVALRWFAFNPAGYHLASILMHALVSALMYLLIRKWSRDSLIALGAALLFAAHPIHTENVCWISNYPDLEASLFILLGLLIYCSVPGRPTLSKPWRAAAVAGVGGCFFMGLLSKETGIVLPVVCLSWELFERRKVVQIIRERWTDYVSMTVAFIAYTALRVRALGGIVPYRQMNDLPPGTELYTKVALYYRYWEKLLWPVQLTAFHKFPASAHWWEWRVLAGVALLLLTFWATVRLWQARRPEALGLLIFAFALAPAFSLPYGSFNLLGERYLYLPSLGFCWLLSWLLSTFMRGTGTKRGALLLVGILGAYSLRTEARNLDWRSEIPFYKKSIAMAPDLAELHVLLGEAYLRHEMYPQALEETSIAAALKPEYTEAANNLGQIYSHMNQPEKAAEQYRLAVQYSGKLGLGFAVARAENNLAFELNRMGQSGDAILAYRKAIELNPEFSGAYNNLGYLFLEQGQYEEAEKDLLRALQLEPTFHQAASNLGLVYARMGRFDLATAYLTEAVRLEPRGGETFARLGEVALAQGDREKAKQLFRHSLELQPDNKRAAAAIAALAAQ